ncbi:ATP-binding cassette domain-containing protein [Pseudooceanicola sp. C21-150M6]|uniref:ATP-binding cassette domain-containing protein n=1 Tax=Pseudooceanicola sp. C21-150M6 TaxID=3434355 RepID=UPI003D7F2358
MEAPLTPVMTLETVSKSFGEVQALKPVSLAFLPGEVHAIVGENGAGKSTLINIASGNLVSDTGAVTVAGETVPADPASFLAAGVAVVFQHPSLLPDLTVLENLKLVAPALTPSGARDLLHRVSPARSFDLGRRVDSLSIAEQHVLEIAKALATAPRLIFFDEPTEPFQRDEVDALFTLIDDLRAAGLAIVYVSHRLHEVTRIADHISVLRDGALIAGAPASDLSHDQIVTLIAGRELNQVFPAKCATPGRVEFEAVGMSGDGFDDLSFKIRAGEILGFAGVEGEGQREALRGLAGANPAPSGDMLIGGQAIAVSGVAATRAAGLRFVPDDRHREGVFLNLSVRENLSLGALSKVSRFGWIRPLSEVDRAAEIVQGSQVKTAGVEAPVSSLSGGNQQKVVIGRALADAPRVLLVDEPTKGVDVGARSEIYRRIRELSDSGVPVIVLSSDAVELEGLCDRVLVFSRGRVVTELTGEDVTERQITHANMTATATRTERQNRTRSRWRRVADSDVTPVAVLLPLVALIAAGTQMMSPYFLTAFSIQSMLMLLAILAFVSAGQLLTVLTGGVDISVGALAGLCVVLASFLLPDGAGVGALVLGAAGILGICAAYGAAQGWLIAYRGLPAIVVTVATFMGLQGVSLALRPEPAGMISYPMASVFASPLLGVPAAMVAALMALVALEAVLTRSRLGRAFRATGSNAGYAARLGLPARRLTVMAYTGCAVLTGMGGLLLAAQVGVGSAVTGVDLSIMSVTAVMIGGVSVTGGRGSMLATLAGAALVQVISSASSFLYSDSALHNIELGLVTIAAAVLFSLVRR